MPVALAYDGLREGAVQGVVYPALARMAARAAMSAEEQCLLRDCVKLLAAESLQVSALAGTRFSGINADGTPWQFCAVLGKSNRLPVRFLTETGLPGTPLTARTQLSLERIASVFARAGIETPRTDLEKLASFTTQDDSALAGLWTGFAMGAGAGPVLRVYANNGWGPPEGRWLRLVDALRHFSAGEMTIALRDALPLLTPAFSPAGIAVTFPSSPALIKIYLRPIAPPWQAVRRLADLLLGAAGGTMISRIETGLGVQLEALHAKTLVASVSGRANSSALDLKLDFCGHCLFHETPGANETMRRFCEALEVPPQPYEAMAEDLGHDPKHIPHEALAFIGIGANAKGVDRLNVYFAPAAPRTSMGAAA